MKLISKERLVTKTRYRTTHDIYYSLLNAMGSEGEHVTRLIYKSESPFTECRKHLARLKELELITYDEQTRLYKITARGARFIQVYSVLKEQLKE